MEEGDEKAGGGGGEKERHSQTRERQQGTRDRDMTTTTATSKQLCHGQGVGTSLIKKVKEGSHIILFAIID